MGDPPAVFPAVLDAIVVDGLGSVLPVLEGFWGVVVASVLIEGFFLPQLSQSMLGALKPLLHPADINIRLATANPANPCCRERVRMARLTFVRRVVKRETGGQEKTNSYAVHVLFPEYLEDARRATSRKRRNA